MHGLFKRSIGASLEGSLGLDRGTIFAGGTTSPPRRTSSASGKSCEVGILVAFVRLRRTSKQSNSKKKNASVLATLVYCFCMFFSSARIRANSRARPALATTRARAPDRRAHMAVRDVPMSGTVDVDELPDDRDEVDTETFAKRMMKPEPTRTALGGPDPLHREERLVHEAARRGHRRRARRAGTRSRTWTRTASREDAKTTTRTCASRGNHRKPRRLPRRRRRGGRARRARGASGKKWFSDQFIRNASIFAGACLGAAYEVATMPTTVQNFNKAVYAATGMLGEYLPRNYDRALGAVDYYAMVLDVVSALVFFALNVGVALAAVLVTVRVIKIFTGTASPRST